MARIRTFKPEFWADEKLAQLDPLTRLVFLGLISMADDAGRLVDSLKQIDAFMFPLTDDTARESLANLARIGRVERGETASGQSIIQIVNWHHQKVDHPNLKAALPVISKRVKPPLANHSRKRRDQFATLSVPVPVPVPTTSTKTTTADSGESGPNTTSDPTTEPAPKPVSRFPVDLCERLHAVAMLSGHVTDFGRFRKALLLLYPASGPLYPESHLAEGLKAYYEAADGMPPREAQFLTIERFVQNVGRWVSLGSMPLANENGVTERGRLAVGLR